MLQYNSDPSAVSLGAQKENDYIGNSDQMLGHQSWQLEVSRMSLPPAPWAGLAVGIWSVI